MTKSRDNSITLFNNVNLGGLSEGKYQGVEYSVAAIVGLDIHAEGGTFRCQQKLTDIDTSNIVDDFIKAKVECSDGASYMFGSTNGKVWRRTPAGTLTQRTTIAAGVIAAKEYNGYIYYATKNNLGRVAVPSSGYVDWSANDDSWATFTKKDDFHPMKVLNLILYIGDGNLIAQVNGTTFTADALDIQTPHRIKALGNYETDLLFGTYINDNVHQSQIGRWNTWSPSYAVVDDVPETGINAFLEVDNIVLVSAGEYGRLYSYNGAKLTPERRVSGDYTETKCTVHNEAVAVFKSIPLFALSQVSGNGVRYGIYSLNRTAPTYPIVSALEYIGTHGSEADVEYGAIINVPDGFLVSWKKGTDYGLDKYDATGKATGYMISRRIMIDRMNKTEYANLSVAYEELPTGTSIKTYLARDGGAYEEFETTVDTERKIITTDVDLSEMVFGDIKLELIPSSNDTPIIQSAKLKLKN